jgi:N-acetylglutamate synthase-like GNAT family acetyltransferase
MPDDLARPTPHAIYLRAAVAADAPAIRRMVRAAGINPLGLHWQNFVVAEDALRAGEQGENVAGIGQVKRHGDGSRELASIAVRPELQGTGIGSAIVRTLLARERGPLYLICREELTGYYARFGFRAVTAGLSPYMRRIHRLGRAFVAVARACGRDAPGPAVMVWPGEGRAAGPQAISGAAPAASSGAETAGDGAAAATSLPSSARGGSQGIPSPAAPM